MTLVSVRMPKPLVEELKGLVQKNHYLDLSEQLRSIVRKKAQQFLHPSDQQKELEQDLKQKNAKLRKQELLKELKDLLEVDE